VHSKDWEALKKNEHFIKVPRKDVLFFFSSSPNLVVVLVLECPYRPSTEGGAIAADSGDPRLLCGTVGRGYERKGNITDV
jgi:hypothetical protein